MKTICIVERRGRHRVAEVLPDPRLHVWNAVPHDRNAVPSGDDRDAEGVTHRPPVAVARGHFD